MQKAGCKKQGHYYSKIEEGSCLFSFWITMTLLFAPCLFQVRILDPKNISGRPDKLSRCRLTGRVCYLWCPSFVLPRQIYCSTIVSPSLPLGWKCTNLISAKLKHAAAYASATRCVLVCSRDAGMYGDGTGGALCVEIGLLRGHFLGIKM